MSGEGLAMNNNKGSRKINAKNCKAQAIVYSSIFFNVLLLKKFFVASDSADKKDRSIHIINMNSFHKLNSFQKSNKLIE
jgi:hypothetical protein